MSPVGIPDMKEVVIDVRERLLAAEVDPVVAVALHVPDGGRGAVDQDTEDPRARVGSVGRYCSPISCFRSPARQSITGIPCFLAQPRMRRLNRPARCIRWVLSRWSSESNRSRHQVRKPPGVARSGSRR